MAADIDGNPICHVCGKEFFLDAGECSHHVSDEHPDGIDYDADADHVPYCLDENSCDDEDDSQ